MLMICAARPLPPHMPSTSIHGLPRFLALSRNPSIPMTSPLLGLNVSYPHPPPSPIPLVPRRARTRLYPHRPPHPILTPSLRFCPPVACTLLVFHIRTTRAACGSPLPPVWPLPLLARAPSVPPCKYARLTQTCAARVAVGADVSLPSLLRALRNPHSTFAFVPSFCAPT